MPARKIETEIAVGGERQFNDAMKGLNSNLKTLRSDMALTTAEFGKNDTSLQGLTKKTAHPGADDLAAERGRQRI